MTPREIVKRTIEFKNPPRMAMTLLDREGADRDIVNTSMRPSPDSRPSSGRDEWGVLWANVGVSRLGEVQEPALLDWAEFDRLQIPDIRRPSRWQHLESARAAAGDKFLVGSGISIYERVHFVRGLENTWVDIIQAPDQLRRLIDILVDMNLVAIEHYAKAGVDGLMWCDDWGLQDRLMIAPEHWREIWKPAYRRIYTAAHQAGLYTLLHSCGYIVDILDDLIEIGLDVIQMDQQENMGLENLHDRFAGRITFWCPVDIQKTLQTRDPELIEAAAKEMIEKLGSYGGGFIAGYYGSNEAIGLEPWVQDVACQAFVKYGSNLTQRRASARSQAEA